MAGGSLESLTINGRTFSVPADTDVNRKLGGFDNEFQANGDGTARQIKSRTPWMLGGVQVQVDDLNGDHEFLQNLADSPANVPVTVTYVDGSIYQGLGNISGEIQFANQSQVASFDLSGPGKLTRQ